jgi:hypothetical protein
MRRFPRLRRFAVKTKSLVVLAALVALAVQVGGASAQHATLALYSADLTLRPVAAHAGGHPRVNPPGLYGAFDATFYPRTGKLQYDIRWKALEGTGFRVVIRSRDTGATYAVLCWRCNVRPRGRMSLDGREVSGVRGTVPISRDVAYLMAGGYTFVEVDTTAFPSGEIGAPVSGKFFYPGQAVVKGEPRCC